MKNLLLTLIFSLLVSTAIGSEPRFEQDIAWASERNLTNTKYSTKFAQYKRKGYMLIDVEADKAGSGMRYSMIWRKNTDKRRWASFRNMNSTVFTQKSNDYKSRGFRLTDLETYLVNNQLRYAAIWTQNVERLKWNFQPFSTKSQLKIELRTQKAAGYRLIDIESFSTLSGTRYSAIWLENKARIDSKPVFGLKIINFNGINFQYKSQGYQLVDIAIHKTATEELYSGIWEKGSRHKTLAKVYLTEREFANERRTNSDLGFRLVDFEKTGSGRYARYNGVWFENSIRYRYARKDSITGEVNRFISANKLVGISVAIVHRGKMIYRRGFGIVSCPGGTAVRSCIEDHTAKVAHSGTIYKLASISKVIGGTIAAKLHSNGRLNNGTRVKFNLKAATRTYLTRVKKTDGTIVSLPQDHKHTVEQLFSHLSCIKHYEGPEPPPAQYRKAIDTLPFIWNAGFVPGCTPGANRNYSTHAFSYVGAVLEKATGRTSAQLIQSEIAEPYNLKSMRALWVGNRVPKNYERAKLYNDNYKEVPFTKRSRNDSWKVFGGGIEASAKDLAWFGEKVRNGSIISRQARENILWKRVNPTKQNGIGWAMRSRSGKRVAEHGGKTRGVRTLLRVYRDSPLVIVIMTNRENQSSGSLNTLANSIAGKMLP